MNNLIVSSPEPQLPATRDSVLALEAALFALPDALSAEELTEQLVQHFFAPQVYGRKMLIPAGMCVVGKIHKHAHLNVILQGLVKVVTEFGEELIQGPHIWTSEPGTKRAVYAIEDTEWLTIHPNLTDTTNLEVLEDYVIAKSYDEYDTLAIEQEVVQ